MEKRKVQKVGYSTLSISLPKDWVDLAGVKHGDTIYVNQNTDGALSLLSEKQLKEETQPKEYHINCDLAKEPNLLERLVVGSYILGVDTVKLFSSCRIKGQQIEEVRNVVQKLIGFSIIEESENQIIIQCSIDPTKIKIQSLIQRQSIIVSTMLNEAIEALFKLNPELANDVIKREDEANNIHWLTMRLLLSVPRTPAIAEQIGLARPLDATGLIHVSRNFEGIADAAKNLAKIALDLYETRSEVNKDELEKMVPLEKMIREMFRRATESLFAGDVIGANETVNLRSKLAVEVEARTPRAAIPYYRPIAITLSIIAERCTSISKTTIDMEIDKSNSFPSSNSGLQSK